MFKNYITIAWRNLLRNKIFSIIKITGLSLGLMVCILIMLYTKDEVSYDRFHANISRLYRITQTWEMGKDEPAKLGITNAILGEEFQKSIPEIQEFVRVNGTSVTVKKGKDVFSERPMAVDWNFFQMFSFDLISGDPTTALKDLNSVVLTKESAKKYFGTMDVIGKLMEIKLQDKFENFVVTGLAKDAPENSTIKYSFLLPFEYWRRIGQNGWIGGSLTTFALLAPKASPAIAEKKMQELFDRHTKTEIDEAREKQGLSLKITLGLQPLHDVHLNKDFGTDNGLADKSSPIYSYILSYIAVFILIIACINFINLALAQSLKRSKEIGVRKVVGGSRAQLIKQFLMESLVVSAIAFAIAILLVITVLPFFNELANKKLSLSYLSDFSLYAGYFLLLLVTAFIAGFYPSLVLSAFQPVKVLYSRQKLMGRNWLTKGLVVLQFALAVFLIIGTLAVNSQLNFLSKRDLGYDSKNLVRIQLPYFGEDRGASALRYELSKQSFVTDVALRNGGVNITGIKAGGKQLEIDLNKIDEHFFKTFRIPLKAGRNFSPAHPSDTNSAVIVNEAFVKAAGWTNETAIGKPVRFNEAKVNHTIIGVIRDYHYRSLKTKITPQLFSMDPHSSFGQVWVKIKQDNIPRSLASIETIYKKINPLFPYDYQFIDAMNAENYKSEKKWKEIIGIAATLFIFISCIGLFGLVLLSIEQRTKEIGIRKVLGAAISRIFLLISKDFLWLVIIAFLIAVPAGYYAVSKWLEDFPYRIEIGWWIFLVAGLLILVISLATISFQAVRAALTNPVKNLRTE